MVNGYNGLMVTKLIVLLVQQVDGTIGSPWLVIVSRYAARVPSDDLVLSRRPGAFGSRPWLVIISRPNKGGL